MRSVEAAIAAIREGKFVVVNDGEDRENEGDLIIAAEKATAEKLAFMVNETSGLICIGLQGERIDELQLPQMVQRNTESHQTAFTVSVDYKVGTSTGISAADRAATIRALADRKVGTEDFSKPGHMFPLRAKPGGVLERPGHTESSVDLARLAGLFPAAAMCEIVNKDGSMMRPDACRRFAEQHGLPCISIADLVAYRKVKDPLPASKVAPAQAASAASAVRLPASCCCSLSLLPPMLHADSSLRAFLLRFPQEKAKSS
jgi:3,4-dihydroxy 2-butanone 4-phosphate synthase/GTP cyclohydrolase II